MTRAELLKEAAVSGLTELGLVQQAAIVDSTQFLERDSWVIALVPRHRLRRDEPASDDEVKYVQDSIDAGLRVHGFGDPVRIEP